MRGMRLPIVVAAVLLCALAVLLYWRHRPRSVEIVCMAVDGQRIVVGLKNGDAVELAYHDGKFEQRSRIPHCSGAWMNAVSFTSAHELICSGEKLRIVGPSGSGREVSVPSSVSGGAFGSVAEFQGLLAVICAKETILLFDSQGKLVKQIGEHTALYGDLRTSPDGNFLVASGHAPHVWASAPHVWASALLQVELTHAYYTFGPIAFGPQRLYIGNQDGCVYQWQTSDWAQLPRVCLNSGTVSQLAVQADGKHLAIAANQVFVEVGNGEARIERNAHAGLAYIDGTKLVTASGSRVEVWDCGSGHSCVPETALDVSN